MTVMRSAAFFFSFLSLLSRISHPGGFSLSIYMMYIYIAAGAACLALLTVVVIVTVRRR